MLAKPLSSDQEDRKSELPDRDDRQKKIFHVNMLRRYHTSNFVGFVHDTNVPEEGDEIGVWETTNPFENEALLGAELTDSHREDVQSLTLSLSTYFRPFW